MKIVPGAPSLALYLDETMYKSHFYTSDALFFMINDIEVLISKTSFYWDSYLM